MSEDQSSAAVNADVPPAPAPATSATSATKPPVARTKLYSSVTLRRKPSGRSRIRNLIRAHKRSISVDKWATVEIKSTPLK